MGRVLATRSGSHVWEGWESCRKSEVSDRCGTPISLLDLVGLKLFFFNGLQGESSYIPEQSPFITRQQKTHELHEQLIEISLWVLSVYEFLHLFFFTHLQY